MSDKFDFAGFTPSLTSIEISESQTMITLEGGLKQSHVVKLQLGTGEEVIFSVSERDLQQMYFVILRVLLGCV